MEKTAACSRCGKEKKLVGQGLCCACYHRERRKRIGAGESFKHGRGEFVVPVDFAPMAFLLEKLRKRAGAELRDIGRQILWELNKSVGEGKC